MVSQIMFLELIHRLYMAPNIINTYLCTENSAYKQKHSGIDTSQHTLQNDCAQACIRYCPEATMVSQIMFLELIHRRYMAPNIINTYLYTEISAYKQKHSGIDTSQHTLQNDCAQACIRYCSVATMVSQEKAKPSQERERETDRQRDHTKPQLLMFAFFNEHYKSSNDLHLQNGLHLPQKKPESQNSQKARESGRHTLKIKGSILESLSEMCARHRQI